MATPMSVFTPAPTGVVATYFGAPGGSTAYYYFIQAIYAGGGRSLLSPSNLVTTVASLSPGSEILVQWNAMAGAIGYNVYRSTSTTVPTVGTNFMATVTGNSFTDNGTLTIAAGQVITDGVRLARARYDFAVDGGGAPGLITLAQSDVIPKNAIMVGGTLNPTTALVGSSTTIAVGTSAGSAANSLKAATAEATYSANAVLNIVPVWATPVKMSADGTITITTAVAALTAGVMDILVVYYMPLS